MSKRSFCREKLDFAQNEENLLEDNQDKVVDMRSRNMDESVVGGFYEEAIRMLQDAYFRISAIDLEKNTIVNLKFMESEALEVERFHGDYRMTILSCADNHVAEDDRENFKKIMAAENLKQIFLDGCPSLHFNYLRFLGGEWKWARTELVPVENFSAENARVMWYVKNISEEKSKETEMTDRLLRTNAELVQAKKELE